MKKIILLDGGMGQELLKRSKNPPSPLWSAQILIDEPEVVEAVHLDYIEAGARVITLCSYSVTPERLRRDGDEAMFEPLQVQACKIAHSAREKSGIDVTIAGCLPPMVASYRPDLVPEFETSLATYRRIVEQQREHVDVFLCETLSSLCEVKAATQAATESGIPVWTAMTVKDGDGSQLRSGEDVTDGISAAKQARANAIMVNCSWPESITQSMPVLAAAKIPFGGYANGFTGIEDLQPGGTVEILKARTDLDPSAYARQAMQWVKQGATLVGGCCEVGPSHISELASQLRSANYQISGLVL